MAPEDDKPVYIPVKVPAGTSYAMPMADVNKILNSHFRLDSKILRSHSRLDSNMYKYMRSILVDIQRKTTSSKDESIRLSAIELVALQAKWMLVNRPLGTPYQRTENNTEQPVPTKAGVEVTKPTPDGKEDILTLAQAMKERIGIGQRAFERKYANLLTRSSARDRLDTFMQKAKNMFRRMVGKPEQAVLSPKERLSHAFRMLGSSTILDGPTFGDMLKVLRQKDTGSRTFVVKSEKEPVTEQQLAAPKDNEPRPTIPPITPPAGQQKQSADPTLE